MRQAVVREMPPHTLGRSGMMGFWCPEERLMKSLLVVSAILAMADPVLAESRSVLAVITHDKGGMAKVTVHSDDKRDRRQEVAVDEACKAVAAMKGWGSMVNVYVVTDRPLSQADRKALFVAIDANHWLDLSYYGREAPRNLTDHFLKP
jgi:hypothetical protein